MIDTIKARVYFGDTDAVGVVYHANYLDFAEKARTEVSRNCGVDILDLAKKGFFFVVKLANLNYIAPAKLEDVLEIKVEISKIGKQSSLEVLHYISNAETKELLCEVKCLLVFVKNTNGKISPHPITQEISEAFNKLHKK